MILIILFFGISYYRVKASFIFLVYSIISSSFLYVYFTLTLILSDLNFFYNFLYQFMRYIDLL